MINLFKSWFTTDKRILGIYRIFFGLLIFTDILRRWDTRHIFYSNDGVVYHYNSSSYFSLLNIFNDFLQPWMIDLFFIVGICFSILFIIGYKTKLSQFIIGTILISLHNRVILVENAGDFVMNCMIVWSFFLPLGSAISIDSLKLSLKKYSDSNTNDLNNNIEIGCYSYKSIAYFAILFQISAIYFFTGLNKTGSDWMSGTAVHYLYQLDTFLTPFGYLVRDYVGIAFSEIATYGTLTLELSVPFLLLFPLYTRYLRQIAVIALVIFHLVIMSSLSIGLFSQTMIVSFILLLDGKLLEYLKSYFIKKNNNQYILFYDSDCGFCHYTARIIKRLDIFNRIIFDNQNTKRDKPDDFDELIKNTAIVYNPETNQKWTKHLSFAKLLSLFPFGFIVSWIFYLPLLTNILKKIYEIVAANRTRISTLLGLAACNIKIDKKETNKPIESQNNFLEWFRTLLNNSIPFNKGLQIINSFTVFILLLSCINYNLVANKSVNEYMNKYELQKFEYIKPLKKIMNYPRMIQRWNMFSPSVLKRDKWLVVEAELSDGSIIDPFTGNKPILDNIEYKVLWKDINQFWRKYFTRIEKKNSQINKLKKWLIKPGNNYFEDRIGDRTIKSVKLWFLNQTNGSINSTKNYKVYKKELPIKRRKKIKKKNTESEEPDILDIIKKNNKKRKNK